MAHIEATVDFLEQYAGLDWRASPDLAAKLLLPNPVLVVKPSRPGCVALTFDHPDYPMGQWLTATYAQRWDPDYQRNDVSVEFAKVS